MKEAANRGGLKGQQAIDQISRKDDARERDGNHNVIRY